MRDPLLDHGETGGPAPRPENHARRRFHTGSRPGETHVHDGRPHVHLPDGSVRYLEEGELPSAPKRRRGPSRA